VFHQTVRSAKMILKNCCICILKFPLPETIQENYEAHACKQCIKLLKNSGHPLFERRRKDAHTKM